MDDDDGGSIARLPLPPYLRSRLLACGYSCIAHLQDVSPLDLSREATISAQEALLIIKRATSAAAPAPGGKTAWDLIACDSRIRRIATGCCGLDHILGGGICPKEVTEICGAPGVGKTQLGMQLAINVQLPYALGGLAAHSIYIDTEGSFMLERVLQMARSAASLANSGLSVDSLLSSIFYFRVFDSTEQIATINKLAEFVEEHKEVKLVIVDSVTFHFRQDFQDLALRTRLLNSMAQKLMALADMHELAVVLVNQVTTKSNGEVRPALGESWSHACTNRLILQWESGKRQAYLFKSPSLPPAKTTFSITVQGIGE